MSPLWGGRFTGQTDPLMARFNASLPFDWRLWEADIAGSIAWANAICRTGLLTEHERDAIVTGLNALRDDIAATLGYAAVTPFRRTFRRWSGTTPVQWPAAWPVNRRE